MDKSFDQIAGDIWRVINGAQNILLACHPRADFDSVGSVLALGALLEGVGKTVTIIAGDTPLPAFTKFFPGAEKILPQNFLATDLGLFDLYIATDVSALSRVSELGEIKFPPDLKIVVIDHHVTNSSFGQINLIDPTAAATAQILFQLFSRWSVTLTHDIALDLLLAFYGDTNSFKYSSVSPATFAAASELIKLAPDYWRFIDELENNEAFGRMLFRAIGVIRAEKFFDNRLIISAISREDLSNSQISTEEANNSGLSARLRSVAGCEVAVVLTEESGNKIKFSGRSRHPDQFDVSHLAGHFGGGGHKAAAGATISGKTLAEVKAEVVEWCRANFQLDR